MKKEYQGKGAAALYTRTQVIRKLIIGALALALAICVTIFIRENMDVKDPEQALPTITITLNDTTALAPEMIFRAGYEWNFLTTTAKHTPPYSGQDLQQYTPPVEVLARTYMEIDFSLEPKNLVISRSDQDNYDSFLDLVDVGTGPIIAPATPGIYMYRIQADFGWRGSIVYFFRVRVQATEH